MAEHIYPIFDKMLARADKEELLGQHGVMIWFTGLSGSGKSTIAIALEREAGHPVPHPGRGQHPERHQQQLRFHGSRPRGEHTPHRGSVQIVRGHGHRDIGGIHQPQ